MRRSAHLWSALLALGAIGLYSLNYHKVPSGFFMDALSNALNGMCIAKTGADEYGNYFPAAIRAFDDWRPPMLVYLFALASFVGPLSVYRARLIAMALGLLGTAFMVAGLRWTPELPRPRYPLVYVACFVLVLLSSWVMVVHRMPVEFVVVLVTVAPMFFLSWRLLRARTDVWLGAIVGVFIGSMLYSYYGAKPLFATQLALLAAFGIERKPWRRLVADNRGLPTAALVALIAAIPTIVDLLGGAKSADRFQSVGNLNVLTGISVFLRHLDLRMFFFSGDFNLRHHTQFLGVLNLAFLPPYLVGLVAAARRAWAGDRFWRYVLAFYILAFVPVSLTNEGIPHSLRTLCCLPALVTIAFLGYTTMERWLAARVGDAPTRALLGGLLAAGLLLASANVYVFQRRVPAIDRDWWTFHPPMWALPETKVAQNDHSAETINERMHRVLYGDYTYCAAWRP